MDDVIDVSVESESEEFISKIENTNTNFTLDNPKTVSQNWKLK